MEYYLSIERIYATTVHGQTLKTLCKVKSQGIYYANIMQSQSQEIDHKYNLVRTEYFPRISKHFWRGNNFNDIIIFCHKTV